jgi:hypothetical protein
MTWTEPMIAVAYGGRGQPRPGGSAIVEFVFLAVPMMVPLFFLVMVLARLQSGAYAVSAPLAKQPAPTSRRRWLTKRPPELTQRLGAPSPTRASRERAGS